MLKVVGQRWMWTNPGYEHIVEVLPEGTVMVVQIIGNEKAIPAIGHIRNLDLEGRTWVYLKGQDKPKE